MYYATLCLFVALIFTVLIIVLIIKALRKYISSKPVREEKGQTSKNLGEMIRAYRIENKMTQEFVAEQLGVSRQAVSKWETGASDPSTSNLITLAKLFNTTVEEILREVQ